MERAERAQRRRPGSGGLLRRPAATTSTGTASGSVKDTLRCSCAAVIVAAKADRVGEVGGAPGDSAGSWTATVDHRGRAEQTTGRPGVAVGSPAKSVINRRIGTVNSL